MWGIKRVSGYSEIIPNGLSYSFENLYNRVWLLAIHYHTKHFKRRTIMITYRGVNDFHVEYEKVGR